MKKHVIYLLVILISSVSCVEDDATNEETNFKILWHLTNVSGGIAGVNDSFEPDTIIWSFDNVNSTLTIENNNTDDTKQDGFDSGNYDFALAQVNSRSYLSIDNVEIGEIALTSSTVLTINENETTSGSGADGFVYTFQQEVVVED